MQATLSHISNLYRHYTHLVHQSLLNQQTHPLLKITFQVELHTLQQQGDIVEFILVQLLKKDIMPHLAGLMPWVTKAGTRTFKISQGTHLSQCFVQLEKERLAVFLERLHSSPLKQITYFLKSLPLESISEKRFELQREGKQTPQRLKQAGI